MTNTPLNFFGAISEVYQLPCLYLQNSITFMTNHIFLSHLTFVYYIHFYLFYFGVVNSLAQCVSHKSLSFLS